MNLNGVRTVSRGTTSVKHIGPSLTCYFVLQLKSPSKISAIIITTWAIGNESLSTFSMQNKKFVISSIVVKWMEKQHFLSLIKMIISFFLLL